MITLFSAQGLMLLLFCLRWDFPNKLTALICEKIELKNFDIFKIKLTGKTIKVTRELIQYCKKHELHRCSSLCWPKHCIALLSLKICIIILIVDNCLFHALQSYGVRLLHNSAQWEHKISNRAMLDGLNIGPVERSSEKTRQRWTEHMWHMRCVSVSFEHTQPWVV